MVGKGTKRTLIINHMNAEQRKMDAEPGTGAGAWEGESPQIRKNELIENRHMSFLTSLLCITDVQVRIPTYFPSRELCLDLDGIFLGDVGRPFPF